MTKTFKPELTVEEMAMTIAAVMASSNRQHGHADRMLNGQDYPGIVDPAVRARIAGQAREEGRRFERLAKKLAEEAGTRLANNGLVAASPRMSRDRRLDKLKVRAREAASWRGHVLKRFVTHHSRTRAITECRHCACYVQVNSAPQPNEIDIGGDAVAIACKGKEVLNGEM